MLTLITGTPGAGKSLYSVWELARKVPGSTIEDGQNAVPRKLFSNVKNLLVDHQHIDADDLNSWHEWAKPGDVILFDEVQEVWRPRGLGSKVPECIAKLETHRHMGVDLILVTQHPMLVDPNIRRLVNQHIHMRRITRTVAMAYEWDHCENPGNTRTCVSSKIWMHPKKAYSLYKSAQLHTKPTVRPPAILWVGVLALAGLAYAGPMAYDRLATSMGKIKPDTSQAAPVSDISPTTTVVVDGMKFTTQTTMQEGPPDGYSPSQHQAQPSENQQQLAGCIVVNDRCGCFDTFGKKVPVEPAQCKADAGVSGTPKAVVIDDVPQRDTTHDHEVLAFMSEQRRSVPLPEKQITALSQIRF